MTTTVFDPTLLDFLSEEIGSFEGGNESFIVPGEVSEVVANTPIIGREVVTINNRTREFVTRTTFINPTLTSITLRFTETDKNPRRIDFAATVASNRLLEVEVGDDRWMSMETFVPAVIRQMNPGQQDRSDIDILLDLKNYGFDPVGRLPMYLQHLGASEELFSRIAQDFIELGARDVTDEQRRRSNGKRSVVQHAYRHDSGVAVAQMDISRNDRSRSATNSGFIGFLDATMTVLTEAIRFDKRRTTLYALQQQDPTNVEIAGELREISELFSTGLRLRAFRNWGGVHKAVNLLDSTGATYWPQQVPCGRLTVLDENKAEHRWSVWTTRESNTTQEAEGETAQEASPTLTSDEEPF